LSKKAQGIVLVDVFRHVAEIFTLAQLLHRFPFSC